MYLIGFENTLSPNLTIRSALEESQRIRRNELSFEYSREPKQDVTVKMRAIPSKYHFKRNFHEESPKGRNAPHCFILVVLKFWVTLE